MNMEEQRKRGVVAIDCYSGRIEKYYGGLKIKDVPDDAGEPGEQLPFAGPGLVDLQVNGVKGVDFNSVEVDPDAILYAAEFLLSRGVTTFCPTVITNSVASTLKILEVINKACEAMPLVDRCIGGIHLEGPFISLADGYRGAHMERFVRAPDWQLFCRFQQASGNRIKIIGLSPEWNDSIDFIERCRKNGLLVSICHSAADGRQVEAAVRAGARLASHLGNAVPLMLPRHPNIIWELLAQEKLCASIIADGFHLPDSFIRVVLKATLGSTILVSDATSFAGLSPGVYRAHIGSEVLLEESGRLSMKGSGGMLAGAAKILPENVEYLMENSLANLPQAWYMASGRPSRLAGLHRGIAGRERQHDMVLFDLINGRIVIREVFKGGEPVWRIEK